MLFTIVLRFYLINFFVAIFAVLVYNTLMKVFKFKFSKLITGFIYAGIALSVAAFGLNIYLVASQGLSNAVNPVYPILQYSLMFLVSVLLFVILLSLLISSYYSVGDGYLKTSFGIIKSKYNLSNAEKIILDRATNKLAVYFKDSSFMMIVVKKEWQDDFISEILKNNPEIEYTINSIENSPDDNLKH